MKSESVVEPSPETGRWYRQPLVWFGVVVFAALVAGIAVTIVISLRFADEPLPVAERRLLATPINRDVADNPASRAPSAACCEVPAGSQEAPR